VQAAPAFTIPLGGYKAPVLGLFNNSYSFWASYSACAEEHPVKTLE